MLQIGASYGIERDTNIAAQPSLRHGCGPEEVGLNKQRGTTEEIFLSDTRRSRRQSTEKR